MLLEDVTNISTTLRETVLGDNSLIQKTLLNYTLFIPEGSLIISQLKNYGTPFYKQGICYCFCYIHLVDEAL